ncbi:MAG: hypothetical protein IJZ35_04980 [Clostridia bacterium]|nr:hypothetical protein [Clostridia bacterium]
MNADILNAGITVPEVNAYTYPQGPRGIGIRNIRQTNSKLIITFDDNTVKELDFPNWWFGTRDEYSALTAEERKECFLFFIRDEI